MEAVLGHEQKQSRKFRSVSISLTLIALLAVGFLGLVYRSDLQRAVSGEEGEEYGSAVFMTVRPNGPFEGPITGQVFDLESKEVVQEVSIVGARNSVFAATSPDSKLMAVGDARWVNGQSVSFVTIYQTTEWQVLQEIETPHLVDYLVDLNGIAFSADSRYLYIYNSNNIDGGGDEVPLRHWISVFDIENGEWLYEEIDVPECGGAQLLPASGRLYLLCHAFRTMKVIDLARGEVSDFATIEPQSVARRLGNNISVSASTIYGQNVYIITDTREIHIVDQEEGTERVLTDLATAGDGAVPHLGFGIDSTGRYLYLPISEAEDVDTGLASAIVAVDLDTGDIIRTMQTSSQFTSIAFDSNSDQALVVLVDDKDDRGIPLGLARIDLHTGDERFEVSGTVSSPVWIGQE